jgi:hypothetical protein
MKDYEEIKEKLKGIQIVFENCESMFIPINCIKQLKYEMEEYKGDSDIKNLITKLDCVIENNGTITRNPDFVEKESPIQRINQYDDICYFDFMYKDGSQDSNYVHWYNDENKYNSENNDGQSSKLLRYNKIHIIVKPYIPKYSINEIFQFPVGTKIKDENEVVYIIEINNDIKHINIPMDEKHINMSYIRV